MDHGGPFSTGFFSNTVMNVRVQRDEWQHWEPAFAFDFVRNVKLRRR